MKLFWEMEKFNLKGDFSSKVDFNGDTFTVILVLVKVKSENPLLSLSHVDCMNLKTNFCKACFRKEYENG